MRRVPSTVTLLADGWTVRALGGPIPVGFPTKPVPATVPGCVHTDLIRENLIADPFDGDNESAQQWIGDTVWQYETTFAWSRDANTRHDLVAYGLDTVATVELNGNLIGSTENQHRSYRFDIDAVLVEGQNTLVVTFAAPVPEAEARDALHGPRPRVNHHPYNQVRKLAANYGWDWGIDVATSGIWQPIGIDSWSGVRFESVRPLVDVQGEDGVLNAHVAIERDGVTAATPVTVTVRTNDDHDSTSAIHGGSVTIPIDGNSVQVVVRVPDVKLWWPIGHGGQPLYGVEATVSSDQPGPVLPPATWSGRVGFRTVELNTTADQSGNPFQLRVNGELVLIRGANWIPDHAFVTEIDRDRYARRIRDAAEANMNLLRVWGGGLYESDDFYDLADEAGMLVWQDFLLACAAYAEEDWLAVEIEAEAREQITRLSPHPSLVIWNGNNENIWGFAEWGWRSQLGGRTWGNGYYRQLFPDLLAELDGTRGYSPGSPYSFDDYLNPNDQRNGTMHIWDVWNQRDYTAYREYEPRFVSEFGFQGPPAWSTLTSVVHDVPFEPYGAQMLVHQKATEGNLKLERGMQGHLPYPARMEDWHWATQLNQAHAVRFGVEHFRSLAPYNTGTIVWQLNDNWPVVSWAAVDFNENRKPLWFALQHAYAPRLATIQPREGSLTLVVLNDTAEPFAGVVTLARSRFGGEVQATERLDVSVDAWCAATLSLPSTIATFADPATELIVAAFEPGTGFADAIWNGAEVIDQELDVSPVVATAIAVAGGYEILVTATSYARDIVLLADRVDPAASVDTGLVTLRAGDSHVFRVTSAKRVEPGAFIDVLVLRHANGLLAGMAESSSAAASSGAAAESEPAKVGGS
jgi:beta-mannosidase